MSLSPRQSLRAVMMLAFASVSVCSWREPCRCFGVSRVQLAPRAASALPCCTLEITQTHPARQRPTPTVQPPPPHLLGTSLRKMSTLNVSYPHRRSMAAERAFARFEWGHRKADDLPCLRSHSRRFPAHLAYEHFVRCFGVPTCVWLLPGLRCLQVVRYSALVGGIAYGILHRRTLQKEADTHAVEHEAKQRESWIEQAKQEYAKKTQGSKQGGLAGLLSGAADKVEQVTGGSSGEC